jgi:hypothetical protein
MHINISSSSIVQSNGAWSRRRAHAFQNQAEAPTARKRVLAVLRIELRSPDPGR